MEESSISTESRGLLGLRFTIDYLLFNKDAKEEWEGLAMENTTTTTNTTTTNGNSPDIHSNHNEDTLGDGEESPKSASPGIGTDASEEDNDEEGVKGDAAEGSDSQEDKPTQSYIALISMAILASEEKKLLLCDIYQWIMDHYPYFKNKVLPYDDYVDRNCCIGINSYRYISYITSGQMISVWIITQKLLHMMIRMIMHECPVYTERRIFCVLCICFITVIVTINS